MSSNKGVSTQWYLGCSTAKEREDRASLLKGSSVALDVVKAIVDKERLDLLGVREADYNDSAWGFKQAHLNGRIDELDRLSNLLRSITDQP